MTESTLGAKSFASLGAVPQCGRGDPVLPQLHGQAYGPCAPSATLGDGSGPSPSTCVPPVCHMPTGMEAMAQLTHRHGPAIRSASPAAITPESQSSDHCPIFQTGPVSKSLLKAHQATDTAWGVGTGDGTGAVTQRPVLVAPAAQRGTTRQGLWACGR